MSTPVILADRFPSSTCDTPTSACHVIIARADNRLMVGNFIVSGNRLRSN